MHHTLDLHGKQKHLGYEKWHDQKTAVYSKIIMICDCVQDLGKTNSMHR